MEHEKENSPIIGEKSGSLLTEDLSGYLKTFTSGLDRSRAGEKTEVSPSLISSVVTRKNPLTDRSIIAIVELIKIAIKNAEDQIYAGRLAKIELSSRLPKEK